MHCYENNFLKLISNLSKKSLCRILFVFRTHMFRILHRNRFRWKIIITSSGRCIFLDEYLS